MAFNNFYNPYYQQPQYAPQQAQQTHMQGTQDERIWVQSEAAAENYLVAPNSFVRLWDSNKPVFYERRSDATGRPFPMEVYEYHKRVNATSNSANELITRFDELTNRVNALEKRIGGDHAESNADDTTV